MTYTVRLSKTAREDFSRLYEHILERELNRNAGDLELADQAVGTIEGALGMLQHHPFTCRRAAENPFLRELVVPFGRTGYVVLFDISSSTEVVVVAIRHQLEDDYH